MKSVMPLRSSGRILILLLTLATLSTITSCVGAETVVNFKDPKVQSHLESLLRTAQSCVVRTRATPTDVRAYFTNSVPTLRSGKCFVACMLEKSGVIVRGKINREWLIHLTTLVNGPNSRVVNRIHGVSSACLDSIVERSEKCELASTYNNCLNENMVEFSFPLDMAEEAVQKMPFHLLHANIPEDYKNSRKQSFVRN